MTASEARLVALVAEAERGPRRDGLYALWLVLRAAEALLPPDPVSLKNHRRRLAGAPDPAGRARPPRPAQAGARRRASRSSSPGTTAAAAMVLAQLVAPTRDVLGPEAADAVSAAARDARLH